MPKIISDEVREMVLKVREFFTMEKEIKTVAIPLQKVNERVSAATGISLRTLTRIINEGKIAKATNSKLVRQAKPRRTRRDKIEYDDSAINIIRRKVEECYSKKEIPTVKLLHLALKEKGYKGSPEIVRQHVIKLGYKFKQPKTVAQNTTDTVQSSTNSEQKILIHVPTVDRQKNNVEKSECQSENSNGLIEKLNLSNNASYVNDHYVINVSFV